jgi:1-acyl-sn-glycerol-3-phosphate acyltransferase
MEKPNRQIAILPRSRIFHWISRIVFSALFVLQTAAYFTLFSFRVRGREHLRGIGNAVLVSNHCHYLDPGFVAEALWPKRVYFTGLEKTFRVPVFGLFIRMLRSFPIPAAEPGRIVRAVGELFSADPACAVHFFPEGRLNPGSQTLQPFHSGAFSVACFFQVPVVPVVEVRIKRRLFFPKILIWIEEPVLPADICGLSSQEEDPHQRRCRSLVQQRVFSVMDARLNLYR